MRARYYASTNGRFISSDPLLLLSGDSNFYRYVGNNPLGDVDESGLLYHLDQNAARSEWIIFLRKWGDHMPKIGYTIFFTT